MLCVTYDDGPRPDFEGLGAGRIITGSIADWWGTHPYGKCFARRTRKFGLVSVLEEGPGTGREKVIRRVSPRNLGR